MWHRTMHRIIFVGSAVVLLALPVVILLSPVPVTSTDTAMRQLPAFNKYQCALCHTTAAPTPDANALNAFGRDFRDNGNVWNPRLAALNSDGDRCSNGFELGDQNGDGIFDGKGTPLESSNPGDASDCTIALTESTWGIIKSIFGNEIQQYQEPFEDYLDIDLDGAGAIPQIP